MAQIARSPTQIINTAASGASAAYNLISTNTNHIFTAPRPGHAERIYPNLPGHSHNSGGGGGYVQDPFNMVEGEESGVPAPPPVLPLINCTVPQNRLEPLTAKELLEKQWTKEELCIRVFKGVSGGALPPHRVESDLTPFLFNSLHRASPKTINCEPDYGPSFWVWLTSAIKMKHR